jgi:outer membrane lipoprotein-sorting protein
MLGFCAMPLSGYAETRQNTLAQAEDFLNSLTTFQADFTQITTGDPVVQKGEFTLKRPDKFVWHYTSPEPFELMTDGTQVIYRDLVTEQITQLPAHTPLVDLLTAPHIALSNKTLQVAQVNESVDEKGRNGVDIVLTPRDQQTGADLPLRYLALRLQRDPWQLVEIITADLSGRETYVQFSQQQLGLAVADSRFEIVLPQYITTD